MARAISLPARRRWPRSAPSSGLDDAPSGEAAQLLLSIIALCWFPLIHARTVAPAVGVTLDDTDDLERRRRHVVDLVLHGCRRTRRAPLASTLTRSPEP